MKTKILVGAVAALLYGGTALAGSGKDYPLGSVKDKQSMNSEPVDTSPQTVIETQPVDESIGGSGQAGMDDTTIPHESEVKTDDAFGGSGYQSEPLREPQVTPPAPVVVEPSTSTAFVPVEQKNERKESKADMRGLSLMIGGGVEGYTGALAPEINPGPAYGVTAALKPTKVLGIELGYSGAVNNLSGGLTSGAASSGPDLVRNGGQAALTLGLGAAPVQPYVLGGIGFSDYNFRGSGDTFRDDTVGNVPVGAGLRTHIGDFTADLRANYNFLFDQGFATTVDTGLNENGRYSGTLNIGGTF